MIHAAHASRYHWGQVGTKANLARGEWQVSRVYTVLGRAEPALYHAHRCLAYVEAGEGGDGIEDWDLPFAYEALARAEAVGGNTAEAARYETAGARGGGGDRRRRGSRPPALRARHLARALEHGR